MFDGGTIFTTFKLNVVILRLLFLQFNCDDPKLFNAYFRK